MKYIINKQCSMPYKRNDNCGGIEYYWRDLKDALEDNVNLNGEKNIYLMFPSDYDFSDVDEILNTMERLPNSWFLLPSIEAINVVVTAAKAKGIEPRCGFRYMITTWKLFLRAQQAGATYFLFGEPLTFMMRRLHEVKKDNYIYSMIPCACDESHYTKDICQFWVLPQHMYLYEGFMDYAVIPFTTLNQTQTVIDSYWSDKDYVYPLYLLIYNMESKYKLPANWFTDKFAKLRLDCEQECIVGNPRCHYCERECHWWDFVRENRNDFKMVKTV